MPEYVGKGQPQVSTGGIGTWWNSTPRYEGATPSASRREDPATCVISPPLLQAPETCPSHPRAIAILIPRDVDGEAKR
jgi:hypothetical protein